MDWLESLLPFILLFIFFLSRLGRVRGQQRRAAAPGEPLTSAAPQRKPTPFEELMRQVQQAAEEARQQQAAAGQPAAPPPPPPAAAPVRLAARAQEFAPPPGAFAPAARELAPTAQTFVPPAQAFAPAARELAPPGSRTLVPAPPAPGQRGPAEFREIGGFEHEQHGFTPDNPFSEAAFAQLPRGQDLTEHAAGHLERSPHGLFARPAAPKRRHPLVERLRGQPGAARDAFALSVILGPPRARRR